MKTARADLLIHPIRLRILLLLSGEQLTTRQIAAALPDVAQASLYRHISRLNAAGILEVVKEDQVRGAIEKVYALNSTAAMLTGKELAEASREDNLRYFTTFLAALLGQFRLYTQQENFNPEADGLSYNFVPIYLDDDEYERFRTQLRATLNTLRENRPAPGRRRRIISTIVIPDKREEASGAE